MFSRRKASECACRSALQNMVDGARLFVRDNWEVADTQPITEWKGYRRRLAAFHAQRARAVGCTCEAARTVATLDDFAVLVQAQRTILRFM